MAPELKCEIIEHYGTISGAGSSMEIQFNLISWAGKSPRYDLRPWKMADGERKQPCKGITLGNEELKRLKVILDGLEEEKLSSSK